MSREEIQKLLGGYATGTLTPAERDALFAAALDDQELFEALAREEPLRELLQDPAAKGRLLRALEPKPAARYWRWLRPAAWAIPAVGLAAILVVFVVQQRESRPVLIARAPSLPSLGPIAPVPSPVPQELTKQPPLNRFRAAKAPPQDLLKAREAAPTAGPKDTSSAVQTSAVLADKTLGAAGPAGPAPPPPPAAPALPPAPKELPLNPPAAAQQVAVEPQAQQGAGAIRLQAAESLQVAGAGGFVPIRDARAMFFGQQNANRVQSSLFDAEQRQRRKAAAPIERVAATPVSQIGLRYSILRRLPNGQFAAAIPNEVLDAADQIQVKLESNEAGSIVVFERDTDGWRQLSSGRIERLTPYTVPASGTLTFDGSAAKDLFVVFSRQPQQAPYPVPEARLDQVINANLAERLTYVVSTAAPAEAQTIAFPINLTHK